MDYYVKFLPRKQSRPNWKVQYVSYKRADIIASKAKKPKREWDIPRNRWRTLGFHENVTIGEAKARTIQLNAQLHLKRQEERLKKISDQEQLRKVRHDAVLPVEFVEEFELRFLRKRDSQTDQKLRRSTRSQTVWRAAQRMIVAIGIDPTDWFYHTHEIYDYFYRQQFSMGP